jgi:hypothetical protein
VFESGSASIETGCHRLVNPGMVGRRGADLIWIGHAVVLCVGLLALTSVRIAELVQLLEPSVPSSRWALADAALSAAAVARVSRPLSAASDALSPCAATGAGSWGAMIAASFIAISMRLPFSLLTAAIFLEIQFQLLIINNLFPLVAGNIGAVLYFM